MSAKNSVLKAFAGLALMMTSCGKPDPVNPNSGPGTDPGEVTSYSISGKAGSVDFDLRDRSVVF